MRTWWRGVPGTPLVFLPFLRAGLTPARAARVVAAVAGSVGWAAWFARFDLPDTMLFTFALVVPWMRFASNALFLYSPEILVFATVPWILLGALAVERSKRGTLAGAAALGLAAGALYIVKDLGQLRGRRRAGVVRVARLARRSPESEVRRRKSVRTPEQTDGRAMAATLGPPYRSWPSAPSTSSTAARQCGAGDAGLAGSGPTSFTRSHCRR